MSKPRAALPSRLSLQLVTPASEPPAGDGWLHELKHDGHRLVAVLDGRGGMRLISRNGHGRFGGAVVRIAEASARPGPAQRRARLCRSASAPGLRTASRSTMSAG